ncbi:peptidase S8 [Candidatus Poribacteria bacterium]|nr:peptidase S8 [Candidatus Poribacteria bacterium]
MSKVVVDPNTGEEYLSNEVLITFVDGTTPDTIEVIISSIGGTIVGTIPGLGIYQVEIPDTGDTTGVQTAIANLQIHPEVVSAETNGIGKPGEVVPNDTKYSSQWGPQKIRADEAWIIARGKVTVAVIDTGVDYNHEDLSGKVIKGKDFADKDKDPMDGGPYKSHGTHVAGIVAANTNNGKGIAGISWGSKILAIKIYKDSGGGATDANFDASVKYAADKGAKIINYSTWGHPDSKTLHNAVKYATKKGILFVTIAGNAGSSTKTYPGAYSESFTVGNTTSTDGRSPTSNYGSWVDIAAPGSDILSTIPDNKYDNKSGTSMAAPHVSGAAAVVWSRHPSWSASKVRQRLEKTAKELPGLQLGYGRIDLFEAIFNGSFEIGDLSEWSSVGTTSSITALGPITPQHWKRMGYASTGPSGDFVAASLNQTFKIQSGVTTLPITFIYTFVTEEYPEWVGTIYNDAVTITLVAPSGNTYTLAVETVNSSAFTPISGIDFPGGDNTVGWTGWKTAHKDIPVTEGSGTYKIFITDAGDDIYDSVILIDNIQFK